MLLLSLALTTGCSNLRLTNRHVSVRYLTTRSSTNKPLQSGESISISGPMFSPAGGPEAAQGEAQGRAGERGAGRGELRADDAGPGPGGVAGVPLRDMQARSAQREAGEQVLSGGDRIIVGRPAPRRQSFQRCIAVGIHSPASTTGGREGGWCPTQVACLC